MESYNFIQSLYLKYLLYHNIDIPVSIPTYACEDALYYNHKIHGEFLLNKPVIQYNK